MFQVAETRVETKLTTLDGWLVRIDKLPFHELDNEGRFPYKFERKRQHHHAHKELAYLCDF